MPDGFLKVEHGDVSLGGKLVPGILSSLVVNGSVRFDSAEVDNLSGKKKTPLGWDDSDVTVELVLTTDETGTCYKKLAEVDAIFKGLDADANPRVYSLSNEHATARGVDQVVFCGLTSAETNDDDVIMATLAFAEHNPPTIPPEVRKSTEAGANPDSAPVANNEVKADAVVTADDEGPFAKGFNQGVS